jgi:hypothetical protein
MLRVVKITFSDDDSITTNMAANVKDSEILEYYKIGKTFNLGVVNDKLVKVTKVEILQ